jgi:hypothetical protein
MKSEHSHPVSRRENVSIRTSLGPRRGTTDVDLSGSVDSHRPHLIDCLDWDLYPLLFPVPLHSGPSLLPIHLWESCPQHKLTLWGKLSNTWALSPVCCTATVWVRPASPSPLSSQLGSWIRTCGCRPGCSRVNQPFLKGGSNSSSTANQIS